MYCGSSTKGGARFLQLGSPCHDGDRVRGGGIRLLTTPSSPEVGSGKGAVQSSISTAYVTFGAFGAF